MDGQNSGRVSMAPFRPDDHSNCAPAWQDYKREFLVRLDAAGLDDKPGKRKVGSLFNRVVTGFSFPFSLIFP